MRPTPVTASTVPSLVAETFTFTLATAPTVTAANKSITVGGSFTASATVSGLQNSDAASVTSATYTYAGTGSTTYASSTTAPTAVGTYSITPSAATLNFTTGSAANYSTPDTYVAGTLTISLAGNVTLLFGTAPTGTTYGQDPTVTATPNPSTGTTVVYSSATPLVCSVNASTGVVTTLAQGTCTIDANDSGNGSYGPASQVAQSFNVATATAPTVTAANRASRWVVPSRPAPRSRVCRTATRRA